MSAPLPLWFQWVGDAMIPVNASAADRAYVVGERYCLEHREPRSDVSHRHEFAWLREAWANLPEHLADLYPSPNHLRRRALIEAGWYDERAIDCGTNAAALRVAAYLRGVDDFTLVIVRGGVVLVRTAKSQSHRAMDRDEFQRSKTAMMEVVAAMIGVSVDEMNQNAGRAA